ncbi:hypothetical protein MLD38_012516 [Melastoma candidum]|uniref:Uncharacterized protein n=1 Tax=Melastoma candidum TaxID=119954 RepID=A0ACB9R6M3_9MYRT|nr:hypothetical protein MLD38_012516 [Melastoma candidum]
MMQSTVGTSTVFPRAVLALVLISLGISHFTFLSNALPDTRGGAVVADMTAAQPTPGKQQKGARTVLELDDYPGSGANNRHTPRSPQS